MKPLTRIAAAGLAAAAAAVLAVPALAVSPQGISSDSCIADNAGLFSSDTEEYITNISVALQESCGAQIGIYTIDYIGNNTMEGYAYEVFEAWGLGDADKDNGLLLLMSRGDDDYWATPGEGLESAFTGNTLGELLADNLEEPWVNADYDTGARQTVLALAERIADFYDLDLDLDAVGQGLTTDSSGAAAEVQPAESKRSVFPMILLLVIIAVIVLAILSTPRGPRGPHDPDAPYAPRVPRFFFFGVPRRPRRPAPPPPPRNDRPGGFGGGRPGGFGGNPGGPRPGGGFHSGGARPGGGHSGGSFRAGGGSTRGGGAGRR